MDIKNLEKELSIAQIDPKANIKLVKISGNSEISVFAAQVAPNTHLNPHYHKVGIEIYQIYQGQGEMKVGRVLKDSVIWEETFKINQGDFFSIEAGKVHQLINTTDKPLIAIFTCPENHLSTDRFFI